MSTARVTVTSTASWNSGGWSYVRFTQVPFTQAPGAQAIREAIRADVADYAMLGCSPEDPPDKVRREWRRLAKILHPDHGGDAVAFQRTREAYARLKRAGKG